MRPLHGVVRAWQLARRRSWADIVRRGSRGTVCGRSRRGIACFFERYFEPARAPVRALGAPAPRILPQGSVAGFWLGILLMGGLIGAVALLLGLQPLPRSPSFSCPAGCSSLWADAAVVARAMIAAVTKALMGLLPAASRPHHHSPARRGANPPSVRGQKAVA